MKAMIISFYLLFSGMFLQAQPAADIKAKDLPPVTITKDVTLHFISPEPIRYVDISTHALAGDLPLGNVLRLKVIPDSARYLSGASGSIVTIAGESFMAQYNLQYLPESNAGAIPTQINILPEQTKPLDVSGIAVTTPQMKSYALNMLCKRRSGKLRTAGEYGIKATLNRIQTVDDLVFLDISYENETNLDYTIDELRFKIEDRKITKATNVQSVEIKPVWQLYPLGDFRRKFHNIYVLKKAPFPENKILNIELTEKQISGRTITLQVKYKDILKADTF